MSDHKYLFECHLSDGTFIIQTQDDKSSTTPDKNAFFDVLQRLDDVEMFGLCSDNDVYAVDLKTGMFSVNGTMFAAQDPSIDLSGAKLRLIYFKRHTHTVQNGVELDHLIHYYFGYQCTVDGKNYQQTISVA